MCVFLAWLSPAVLHVPGSRIVFLRSSPLAWMPYSSGCHVFAAAVGVSFDTLDRGISKGAMDRLGLLAWFREVYFAYHSQVRLRFKLAGTCQSQLAQRPSIKASRSDFN